MFSNNRKRIFAIIMLAVSLTILAAGIAGRVMMGRITEEVMSNDYLGSICDSSSGAGAVLNRGMGRMALRLTVSLIKNDPSGFIKAVKSLTGAIGSLAGSSGIVDLFAGSFMEEAAREAFQEARQMLVEYAGAKMPLLVFAAYYSELFWIGGILFAGAAVLWFVAGGGIRFRGISCGMQPALSGIEGTVGFDEW